MNLLHFGTLPLVPAPTSGTVTKGQFRPLVSDRISIPAHGDIFDIAHTLAEHLGQALGLGEALAVETDREAFPAARIRCELQAKGQGDTSSDAVSAEAYSLEVALDAVTLRAETVTGLFRAAATLSQLMTTDAQGHVYIPLVQISDRPRYSWRGLSLDVARSFFPVNEIECVIDLLAQYKMNVLHLHLSDDHGWRLEILSRPELTARSGPTAQPGARSGYYSQQEYRHIVAYASARQVTIVPEIDIPGHTNAIHCAYPELNPSGGVVSAATGFEIGYSALSIDVAGTQEFLQDVFREVAELTPGEYIHFGGDEAHTMSRDEYVRTVQAAQTIITSLGKKAIGWAEAAATTVDPRTILQLWDTRIDPGELISAARQGTKILMSPSDRVYLDMMYAPGVPEPHEVSQTRRQAYEANRKMLQDAGRENYLLGQNWAGYVGVQRSYDWDPQDVLPHITDEQIIGVEAAIWTESIPTFEDLMVLLLPRLACVSEVAWSASGRDWPNFQTRLAGQVARWQASKLPFHRARNIDW